MRRLATPKAMTYPQFLWLNARTMEKTIGELQAKTARPAGPSYPRRVRERDVERLRLAERDLDECERRLRAMALGARANAARRRAA